MPTDRKLVVALPADVHRALKVAAAQDATDMSTLVRDAIASLLAARKKAA